MTTFLLYTTELSLGMGLREISGGAVYYWNGSTTTQIANNINGWWPSLYNGSIAWTGFESPGDGGEIYYWDGENAIKLTDNSYMDIYPSLYDGTIAWSGRDSIDGDLEIFYWNGEEVIQITNNNYTDQLPSLYNGTIAWDATDGTDTELFYWDGGNLDMAPLPPPEPTEQPIPEPSTILLLSTGIGGIATYGLIRRKKGIAL